MNKYLLVTIGVLILILGTLYLYTSKSPTLSEQESSFSHDGVVLKDNPGFKPGVWFLSYEEPGSPGLSVELNLNSVEVSHISLSQGERVRVEGTLYGNVVAVRTITSLSVETGMPIKLYFYNPALDQGPGGVQCSRNGLVAVERIIPKTQTPLTDAVKLLLRGEISDSERASGIQSEFPLQGLTLVSAAITDGVATLTLNDPQHKTVGGSCRVGILWAQISETAKQFATVKSVRFMPEELFQP